jgi:FAD-binding domain/Ferric reductase NAD binding domain
MGYFFTSWGRYDYILVKIKTDAITQKGLGAGVVLSWIVLTSLSPIRGWNYEVFVIQHLLSFTALVTMIYLHVPQEVHVWVWISVGLFFLDRLLRLVVVLYNNFSLFHPRQRREGKCSGIWACKAEFIPLSHNTTRVTIANPPINWEAGQHVFLSCHSIVPLQSHPFTICSLPEDGKMEFLIKAKRGGTSRFFRHAERNHSLPMTAGSHISRKSIAIEGPYGRIRPLRQFDTVILLAGSTGASFTMPLMRDIVSRWGGRSTGMSGVFGSKGVVTRKIRFVWVVKSKTQVDYFGNEIERVIADVKSLQTGQLGGVVDISIYITCDESFTSDQNSISLASSSTFPQEHWEMEEAEKAEKAKEAEKAEEAEFADNNDEKKVPQIDESEIKVQAKMEVEPVKCCCTDILEDENAIAPACNCDSYGPSAPPKVSVSEKSAPPPDYTPTPSISSIAPSLKVQDNQYPNRIRIFSGRPDCRNIIQKELELAYGESAVVVCGPSSLVDTVRDAVVTLSDERAVHKGTGAQGVNSAVSTSRDRTRN